MAAAFSVASTSETIGKYTRLAFLWLIKIFTTSKTRFYLPLILARCRRSKTLFLDSDFYETVNFLEKRTR